MYTNKIKHSLVKVKNRRLSPASSSQPPGFFYGFAWLFKCGSQLSTMYVKLLVLQRHMVNFIHISISLMHEVPVLSVGESMSLMSLLHSFYCSCVCSSFFLLSLRKSKCLVLTNTFNGKIIFSV